jgi:glycosyltransferase involved in cell wall biosynthesis
MNINGIKKNVINIYRLSTGIINYIYLYKKKLDIEEYVKKNSKLVRATITVNSEGIVTSNQASTKISGYWLKWPKLHYYVFNYKKQKSIDNELKKNERKINRYLKKHDYTKETVILALHELSRTGAPILGYELAKHIKEKYNIFVITLKSGELSDDFENIGVPVFKIDYSNTNSESVIDDILEKTKTSKAIVNSICAYPFLNTIKKKNIPIVTLVHEFYPYINCPEIFHRVHAMSKVVIYPAQIVVDSAFRGVPDLEMSNVCIMPQGFIPAPSSITSKESYIEEEKKIYENMDFSEGDCNPVVILGIGSIEPRKGVDLFISTAQLIRWKNPEANFRFVWIGDYPLKEMEIIYGIYLQEQIEKAGLKDIVKIISPVKNLEIAYSKSDIFFLSSRLDPLPLVSIEAMRYGVPLICFEGASGISDYLLESNVSAECVISHLNVAEAAIRIHDFIKNKEKRECYGFLQKKFSIKRFDMEKYVSGILDSF